MLKRKIVDSLNRWKNNKHKKACCILGARQIGKSTSIREFGKQNYQQVIEINFIEDPKATTIFEGKLNERTLLENITAYTQKTIVRQNTLLILDEIQECPNARTAIKFLVEGGTIDIAETGSLLGVRYKEVRSYPVGFEKIINMYPLDFEEFLWAVGVPLETIDVLRTCYEKRMAPTSAIHETMMQLFFSYMIVGGMPEVVQDYINHYDLARVKMLQTDIIQLYRQDISKYAQGNEKIKIKDIFDSIPSQLDQKNRRFKLSKLDKNGRMNRYENAFLWLQEAGVALACLNTKAPVYPLKLNTKRNLFKLYLNDTGLLCSMLGNIQFELLQGNTSINQGSILENMFAQCFASKNRSLYYYDSKTIELDFLLEEDKKIQIIEIKSGSDYKKHPSLNKALASNWNLTQGIVFSKFPLEEVDNILYLPYYMILFFGNVRNQESLIWKVDLAKLSI
ncbi:ATP-binding protein [Dubosiella newyorkensis]|jgi:predicted AAA+ superfamily ATPase|uniref:ATP-binding protein n=1 Tax=Dubosiella newyorkensis TaxID=1862672 RepID=UPI00235296BD|nr:AAA family ATPase [Dubosiella newyorkensis]MCI9042069.1 ATP-binding protein [Dubosiella newyorkensis]